VQVNIKNLINDVQYYQAVRELRWPGGIACPSCESKQVIKRGFDDTEPARQRYRLYQGLWCSISHRQLIEAGRCLCQATRKSPSVLAVYAP
jgi:glutathionyl-hydroquinone reductase